MYKILIVEDDNTIAERLASHLKKWNYKNISSSNGNIKLKMCRKVELFDKRMVLGVVVT